MHLCKSTIEACIRTGLGSLLPPNADIHLPVVHANRGTFTSPVYISDNNDPIAIFRLEAGRKLVGHEAHTLNWIHKHNTDGQFNKTLPEILWQGTLGSRQATLQTFLKGKSPAPAKWHKRLVKQFAQVADWLTTLYQTPISLPEYEHDTRPKTYACYMDPDACKDVVSKPFLPQIENAIQQLQKAQIPPVLCHADLHLGNMLVSQNGLCVLDWEYADLGWPVFDWFYYLCTILFEQSRHRPQTPDQWTSALEKVFIQENTRNQLLKQTTRTFFERLHIVDATLNAACLLGLFDFLRRRLSPSHLEAQQDILTRISAL